MDFARGNPQLIKDGPKRKVGRVGWGCVSPERSEGTVSSVEGRRFKSGPAHHTLTGNFFQDCEIVVKSGKVGRSYGIYSNFSFGQDGSEVSMFWAFKKSHVKLGSFTLFVWTPSQLPSLFRGNFYSALRAFSHNISPCHEIHSTSDGFHLDFSAFHQIVKKGGKIGYGEG